MRWVAFSSVFAGITGYLVILLASSTFGADERFRTFNVFWGLFFMVYGTLQGLMHETTRGVRSSLARQESGDDPTADDLLTEPVTGDAVATELEQRARPFRISLAFGAVAAGVVLASSPLWIRIVQIEPQYQALAIVLMTVSTALGAVQSVYFGLLSGSGKWRMFGILLSLEALARILVTLLALVLSDQVAGFLFATVAGVIVTPLAILLSPLGRSVIALRADVRTKEFVRRGLHSIVAASAASILVVGFPVFMSAARPGDDHVVISNLLLAVTLTRAPVLVPITSFQNAIVVYFVDRVRRGRRVVWAPVGIVLGVASLGAVLAWLVGPPIMAIMGKGFGVGGEVLAALTFAAGFTGALYVTGSAVLARERHGAYVAGWLIASGIAIVLLVVVPGALVATVLALTIGPATGATFHVLVGMRGSPSDGVSSPRDASVAAPDPADPATPAAVRGSDGQRPGPATSTDAIDVGDR